MCEEWPGGVQLVKPPHKNFFLRKYIYTIDNPVNSPPRRGTQEEEEDSAVLREVELDLREARQLADGAVGSRGAAVDSLANGKIRCGAGGPKVKV
jgi:hypothetical protein